MIARSIRKGIRWLGMLAGGTAVLLIVGFVVPWYNHFQCDNPDGMDFARYYWMWIPANMLIGWPDGGVICLEEFGTELRVISDHFH